MLEVERKISFCASLLCAMTLAGYMWIILLIQTEKDLKLFISSAQSLSCVRLFAIPWTAARQASLSITNSWSLLRLMSIEMVMPSSHLILCHPLLLLPSIFPSIRVFSKKSVLSIRFQHSVLPMNIQDWFPLGWTGWISLQSKGASRVFSNVTVQKHEFFGAQLSLVQL